MYECAHERVSEMHEVHDMHEMHECMNAIMSARVHACVDARECYLFMCVCLNVWTLERERKYV